MKKAHKASAAGGFLLGLVCCLLLLPCSPLSALDFLLRPRGFLFIPMGPDNIVTDRFKTGGGVDIGLDMDLSSAWSNPAGIGYTIGLEGGFATNTMKDSTASNYSIYSVGGAAGLYYFPLSRLFLRIDGTAGVYSGAYQNKLFPTPCGFYWRAGGELGFRFTPSFLIALNSGWRQYEDPRPNHQPVNTGVMAGLTAQFTMQAGQGAGSRGAEAVLDQSDPVYPAFLQLYQTNSIGNVAVRNRENAEIRNVRLSFRADNYTSSEFSCGSVPVIARGEEAELPLYADFSPDILRFTDEGRILGELVIRYNFLGQERMAVSAATVTVYSRNTVTESDTASLAAFISPTSPETLDYSKYIIGLARSRRRIAHNQNMQYAVWLFEGLRALGMRIGDTYSKANEVQFPAETLVYGTGSNRDIALLYAATLESVGISSAFIKEGSDYIVAVDLSITLTAASTLFNNNDRILSINNDVWLPIAMSSFNDGFIASWTRAIVTLNQAFARGETVDFVMVRDAWSLYPPAPLPGLGTRNIHTNSDAVISESDKALDQYVNQDIMPLIWSTESQIRTQPSPALYNRLGLLQSRAGRIADAKTSYQRAAATGSVMAMINLGNLALNDMDYAAAENWFRQALKLDSTNSAAQQGLDRVNERR